MVNPKFLPLVIFWSNKFRKNSIQGIWIPLSELLNPWGRKLTSDVNLKYFLFQPCTYTVRWRPFIDCRYLYVLCPYNYTVHADIPLIWVHHVLTYIINVLIWSTNVQRPISNVQRPASNVHVRTLENYLANFKHECQCVLSINILLVYWKSTRLVQQMIGYRY